MMPLAPTPIVQVPSKPKIGFSIDSIVGGANHPSPQHSPIHLSESSGPLSPSSDRSNVSPHRLNHLASPNGGLNSSLCGLNLSPKGLNLSPQNQVNSSPNGSRLNSSPLRPSVSPSRSPPPSPKPPIMVPGIPAHSLIRPSPTYDPNLVPKNGFLQPEMMHNHGGHPFALAAHFQGAALAAALSSGQPGFAQHSPLSTHTPPRESYPLYPWLLSRHGRIFPHRFPGGKSIIYFK
ncbi:homeotic protein empty spiracles-like [Agrilus planipennis]|uniref:Homeotic protein empty spiracles-like n=1 Tax=Agrilus planipennis TaxID=224129 RepID=A0A7F5RIZ3_AGRPL|nr:homeotic protein empty spiracles-like [Agrilus planipennis]